MTACHELTRRPETTPSRLVSGTSSHCTLVFSPRSPHNCLGPGSGGEGFKTGTHPASVFTDVIGVAIFELTSFWTFSRFSSEDALRDVVDPGCGAAKAVRARARRIHSSMQWSFLTQVFLLLSITPMILASPTHVEKRETSVGPQVIAPVAIIGFLLMAALLTTCFRKKWHGHIVDWGATAAESFGPSTEGTQARELTAQQLAGGMTATAPTTGTQRPRRTRRNRRTPSQISTHSLPVYMKEPGEQEIIIHRGPEDMEDVPITNNATTIMPSVVEQAETPDLSVDMSHIPTRILGNGPYVREPDSPNNMPLLAREESNPESDISGASLSPPANRASIRRSVDTIGDSDESNSALLAGASPVIDPRGEAPPYFEAVQMEDFNASPNLSSLAPTPEIPYEPEPEYAQETISRRTRFMNLFHHHRTNVPGSSARPDSTPGSAHSPSSSGHQREGSGPSVASVVSNRAHARVRPLSSHRPSFSAGSIFSVMSRSRSGLLDETHLTSPSLISVNSISAPLPHTLVRTEFTYPKSGPTPDQIRLISSRESFARFGVPYGEEAIAYAASTSRVELPSVPPPEFETVVGSSSRAQSRAEQIPEGEEAEVSVVTSPHTEGHMTSEPGTSSSSSTPVDVIQPRGEPSPMQPSADHEPVQENVEVLADKQSATTLAASPQEETLPADESSKPLDVSRQLQDSPIVESIPIPPGLNEPAETEFAPTPTPSSSTSKKSYTSASSQRPLTPLSGTSNPGRAESRASSYFSFTTAEESIAFPSASVTLIPVTPMSPESPRYPESEGMTTPGVSAPATPRMPVKQLHLQEHTDTTLTNSTPTTPRGSVLTILSAS